MAQLPQIVHANARQLGGRQGFQGGVRGVVKDSSGIIPGAEVTLTD
jgi:hypothetical protein